MNRKAKTGLTPQDSWGHHDIKDVSMTKRKLLTQANKS